MLATSFAFGCGKVAPNRFYKAATTEALADPATNDPNERHNTLYRAWSLGGAGVIVTGNVMVDRRYLESPCNVVVDASTDPAALAAWAKSCHAAPDAIAIVQLSHAGRQCPLSVTRHPVAPSAVPFRPPGLPFQITSTPRALTHDEISHIVDQFVTAAVLVVAAGFDGVQLHSAHGYLLSSFLSPHVNLRGDAWGGSKEKRRRLLLMVVDKVRQAVGPAVIVGVKLNSADFQRGGFSEDEAHEVLQELGASGSIDFVEISGGTYENPAFMSETSARATVAMSTAAREGYFLKFAEKAKQLVTVPLVVSGGFRTKAGMEAALAGGSTDLIGIARPLIMNPNFPKEIMSGARESAEPYTLSIGFMDKLLVPALNNLWHQCQIRLMAEGQPPNPNIGVTYALTILFVRTYFIEPRRNPIVFASILSAFVATTAAAARWGYMRFLQ